MLSGLFLQAHSQSVVEQSWRLFSVVWLAFQQCLFIKVAPGSLMSTGIQFAPGWKMQEVQATHELVELEKPCLMQGSGLPSASGGKPGSRPAVSSAPPDKEERPRPRPGPPVRHRNPFADLLPRNAAAVAAQPSRGSSDEALGLSVVDKSSGMLPYWQ